MQSNRRGMGRRTALARRLALALLPLALSAPAAFAQPRPAGRDVASYSVDELKRVYLACDRAATRARLDIAAAAGCSEISQELLRRGFGGNSNGLLAWWRVEKNAMTGAGSASVTR